MPDNSWVYTGVLICTLRDHEDAVICVDLNEDGTLMASGGGALNRNLQLSDNVVRIWKLHGQQAATATVWHRLEGHVGMVRCVKFSSDCQTLASASEDWHVILWSVLSGRQLQKFQTHKGGVRCVAWSLNNEFVVTGGFDKILRVWAVTKVTQLQGASASVGHAGGINCVVLSKKMDFLVSASGDHNIMIWELSPEGKATLTSTLRGHTHPVVCISLSPDNVYIASTSEDNTIRIWDIGTGQMINVLEGHSDFVNSVVWSSDGTFIASASDDTTVRLWGTNVMVSMLGDVHACVIYKHIFTHTCTFKKEMRICALYVCLCCFGCLKSGHYMQYVLCRNSNHFALLCVQSIDHETVAV
jgi:WD40 repeat protein